MLTSENRLYYKNNWFLCILFAIPFVLRVTPYRVVGLYAIIPGLFIYTIFMTRSFITSRYLNLYLLLVIWITFTFPFSVNLSKSLIQMSTLLGTFILCYEVNFLSKSRKNIILVHFAFLLYWITLLFYAYERKSELMLSSLDKVRLNDETVNANSYGYITFYATISSFLLSQIYNGFLKNVGRVLFVLSILATFVLSLWTASRQILVVQIPLVISLLYVKYILRSRYKIIALIIGFIVLSAGAYVFFDFYEDSFLQQRFEIKIEDDSRYDILVRALEVGFDNFFLGVGPGNFSLFTEDHAFSHSTYFELFANSGILAVVIYIIMLYKFIILQYRRYLLSRDKVYLYFFIFGLFFAFDNLFFVFYYFPFLMSYFFLIAQHSENYYNYSK